MLICPKKEVAFIHIPKTGGTSVTRCLARYTCAEFRDCNPRYCGTGFQGTWHYNGRQHAKYRDECDKLPRALLENLRFMAVIRNPYSWVYSVYREFYAPDGASLPCSKKFAMFDPERRVEAFFAFVERSRRVGEDHFGVSGQWEYIEGIEPRCLDLLKFEEFPNNFKVWLAEHNIEGSTSIPHDLDRGADKRRDVEDIAENFAYVEAVNKLYSRDFEPLGYAKI